MEKRKSDGGVNLVVETVLVGVVVGASVGFTVGMFVGTSLDIIVLGDEER